MFKALAICLCLVVIPTVVLSQVDTARGDTSFIAFRSVEVSAGLVQRAITNAPFTVELVDSATLSEQPVRNVVDALAYVPGVDLRRRGALGVQTDVAIRGGTFEQTAVLLNGIRLNDVQTGHNTLSLPFLPTDIDRLEVLKGGAARFFGAGALDGAVNIVLKRPRSSSLHASVVGGDVGYKEGRLSGEFETGLLAHQLSVAGLQHNGWVHNTDVEVYSGMYHGVMNSGNWNASIVLGVNSKAFGANGFYSPRFPDQYEKVHTYVGGVQATTILNASSDLTFRLGSRVNHDDFVLRRNDPDFYHNTHRTDAHLFQVGYRTGTNTEHVSVLAEVGHDAIHSSNLGDHARWRGSIMAEYANTMGRLGVSGGLGVVTFTDRAPLPTGGLEFTYDAGTNEQSADVLYANIQRSGRIPTYTELYYTDYQTSGNANLVPESALTAEVGYRRTANNHHMQAALFSRHGTNVIDYAIVDSSGFATAANINTVDVIGLDLSSGLSFATGLIRYLRAGLTLQKVTASAPTTTRYIADNLSFLGIVEARASLPFSIQFTYILRTVERVTKPTVYVTHDVKLSRQFNSITLFAEATNLASASYIETGWVTIPPRWFRAGASVQVL